MNPYSDYLQNMMQYPVSAAKLGADAIGQTASAVSAIPGTLWDLLSGAQLGQDRRFDLQKSFSESGLDIPRLSDKNDANRVVEGSMKAMGIPAALLGTMLGTTGIATDVNDPQFIPKPRLGALLATLGLGATAMPWMTGIPGMPKRDSAEEELRRRYEQMTKIESPEESFQKKISDYLGGM